MIIAAIKSAFLSYKTRIDILREIAEEFEQEFGLMPEYVENGYRKIRSRK